MLNSGRVLCSCTSHIGQNRLVSKYLTMQDRQTVQKQIYVYEYDFTNNILRYNNVHDDRGNNNNNEYTDGNAERYL